MILELSHVAVQLSMLSFEGIAALLVSIVLPIILVTLFSFVPAFIELRKPRDSGPRLIAGESIGSFQKIVLLDVDRNLKSINLGPKGSLIFPLSIVNLEA
jgi:hypothetical protein